MTDQLIANLGRIGALRVISCTSVMQYKDARKPLPEIGRELGVDAVIEGSVLRSGDRVRVTAQLIRAAKETRVWGDTYERDIRDVLALQGELAKAITDEINVRLAPEAAGTSKPHPAVNPAAYEDYLKGRFSLGPSVDATQKSIPYFEKAIREDPNYALAYVGLADSYVLLGHVVHLPPNEAFPKAKAAVLKALQLDDTLAAAHGTLADVKFLYDWDWTGADEEYKKALRLNPSSAGNHESYADFLAAQGRSQDALEEAKRAKQLDPLFSLAFQLYFARHYDEAVTLAKEAVDLDPRDSNAHLALGLAYEQKHEFRKATEELRKAVTDYGEPSLIAFLGHLYAVSGRSREAEQIVNRIRAEAKRRYVSPFLVALVYSGYDNAQALVWLQKSYESREHDLVFLNCWPMFDPLRSDPQYQDLLRRIGLPQ